MQTNYAAWPKGPIYWRESDKLLISIPFTWNLPQVKSQLRQTSIAYTSVLVGGPAVKLMPGFFADLDHVQEGENYPDVLHRVNPWATRTTEGCIRSCKFCGIGQRKIERHFVEYDAWPDLPLICDNNLLASSRQHFDVVIDRLKKWKAPDFNQGLDARLLTDYHAQRLAELKQPKIRLSCDSLEQVEQWENAYEILLRGGVKKSYISTYALIGFDSDPAEAWLRCKQLAKFCIVYPMWFHPLDVLRVNQVTKEQHDMSWTQKERVMIMRKFYKAKYGGYQDEQSLSNSFQMQNPFSNNF